MAAKTLSLKEKLIKTLRLRGFAREILNIEKNSKIFKFLQLNKKDYYEKISSHFDSIFSYLFFPCSGNKSNDL
jgi:hypothetical protein